MPSSEKKEFGRFVQICILYGFVFMTTLLWDSKSTKFPSVSEWAGTYMKDINTFNGMMVLTIEANGNYCIFSEPSCFPKEERKDHLEIRKGLIYVLKKENFYTSPKSKEIFLPIPWGEKKYLVEENRILEFCNAVNLGLIQNDCISSWGRFSFYTHKKGFDSNLKGLPSLPQAWQKYIFQKTVTGQIEKVISEDCFRIPLGKKHNIFKGMILSVRKGDRTVGTIEIFSVEEKYSLARNNSYEVCQEFWPVTFHKNQVVTSCFSEEIFRKNKSF